MRTSFIFKWFFFSSIIFCQGYNNHDIDFLNPDFEKGSILVKFSDEIRLDVAIDTATQRPSTSIEELNELIEHTLLAKGDSEDIEIARNALADDNAPAVMRALARIEAESIDVEVEDVIPDGQILKIDDDEIPFVDLSSNEEE